MPGSPSVFWLTYSEEPAPLADAALGQGEDAKELAACEEPEVLPHI